MASEYDPDDELAQWVGGYFNGDGSLNFGCRDSKNNIKHSIYTMIFCEASTPEAAGLFDAEGTIDFSPTKDGRYDEKYTIHTQNRIRMTTLEDIERFAMWLETIGVKPKVSHDEKEPKNWEDSYKVYVSSLEDTEKVLKNLKPYLSKSKGLQAFIALSEIIPRIKEDMHLSKRGYIETVSWIDLQRSYKGNRSSNTKYTLEYFREEWPNVEPRKSHLAPSKEEFKEQLFGNEERETFEEKTGPSPRQPDKDWDGENDPFNI